MYKNYGDENFFELGRLVEKESDTEYRVITCDPSQEKEGIYRFAECLIDITDSWIDKDQVMSYGGMTEDNYDALLFALDCIEFYGVENFGAINYSYDYNNMNKEDIINILKNRDIEDTSCYIEEELERKREQRRSEHYAKSTAACKVDMWYGDAVSDVDKIDIMYSDGMYRGNCFIKGKFVGDYISKNTEALEKKFSHLTFNWDAETEPMDICLTDAMKDMLMKGGK